MLAAGVLRCVTFFLPTFLWATAAFRPERDPEITQALVDLGWGQTATTHLSPLGRLSAALGQPVLLARRHRDLPEDGPFVWNGVLVWWIPFATFSAWIAIMVVPSRRAYCTASSKVPKCRSPGRCPPLER
jgi:hypothetical protein